MINPRYIAYCHAHGVGDHDLMTEQDRVTWPGGVMTGFVLWIDEQWRAWKEHKGYKAQVCTSNIKINGRNQQRSETFSVILSDKDHEEFDAWLTATYPLPSRP